MSITITQEFQTALDSIEAGGNVLITGKAGTGKSTLLRTYLDMVEDKNILVTAPTGVAALNIGGFTIHRSFGFRPGMYPDDVKPGGSYRASSDTAKLLKSLDILVVDEISMVRADLFDMMNVVLQKIRNNPLPFGGVQLILVGDLLQLPPIVTEYEATFFSEHWDSPYFFSAHCYDEVSLKSINLTTVWRQTDEEFIEILNQVREGSLSDTSLQHLNKQVDKGFKAPDDWVTLASHRRTVDQINQQRLESLSTEKFMSVAEHSGESDSNSFSGSEELHYAVGARVMTIINDQLGRFVNGSFGTVTGATKNKVSVQLDHSGETVELEKHVWEVKRPAITETGLGSDTVGSVRQFPVILAWAVTIHKSQGKTISKLLINLKGGTTTDGQFYVALSRGVSLENLRLSAPVEARHIRANNSLVRRIRRNVSPVLTTNRVTFLSVDGVNFGISDHVARIHAIILEDGNKVAEFGTWINPMSDLGSFGERQNVPAGGLAMAPTLSDFWPLLLRQAAGSIVIGDNLPMLERAIRHQEKGMNLGLGTGYDISEFGVNVNGNDVIQRCQHMVSAYRSKPFQLQHGHTVPPASQKAEGAVFIPSWAPKSPMQLDLSEATESDRAWAAYSGGETNHLVPEEVAETADLLSSWAVSRGYWTVEEEKDVRARANKAGMDDVLLPKVEAEELDVPSLLIPGTRIAFTGRNNLLSGPADDDRLKEICESRSLEYKKSVSKSKCDVLVALDPASQSRKAQAAREHGKPIIRQEDFEHWYNHGPFLEQALATEKTVHEETVSVASPAVPEPIEPQTREEETRMAWVKPEEFFKTGTRVAFRGSTYVQEVLLPQGEPLQGLCAILDLEYKQAVTKTRCDVLVTDDPNANDGKMKLARMHNKPLIHQSEFDDWASRKLAELEYESLGTSIDDDEPEETTAEEISEKQLHPTEEEITHVPEAEEPAHVSYAEYVSMTQPQKMTPAATDQAPYGTANSVPAPTAKSPAKNSKAEKAIKRTKQFAIVTGIISILIIVFALMDMPTSVGVPAILAFLASTAGTGFYGVSAIINRTLDK